MNRRRNPRHPLPRARLTRAEILDTQVNAVVAAMRAGDELHLHFERGRAHWHLSNGASIDPRVAHAVIDCPEVESLDDALPVGGAIPQTYVIRS
jgi:hypothetical protein